ncbi:hypothetical protein BX616_001509 [Lobosporangium transversale]|uniref:Armadillo-type protein n=1 Tax=Lobosporangium transversale TaxID=64571 RepID=A0A1Y2GVT9_9FUNG|nr:armadillo-type protein [Lobosporangium transversale]KAF9903854.1 hypothetical protein BX616_001509 [Lobosporangium transversale]ORZ26377.1 armadillo-type protein [Lobosporangium transversale]|eukprot:XP_021884142.1 armadillo-type protein [Lobosporangium transversale]
MSSAANAKPVLQGVKIRPRKGVQKATAKFEPTVFRDAFISVISSATPGNLDDLSTKLDAAGNNLEYRRYAETLFELLITGRLLAPGGTFLEDGTPASPFSIFQAQDDLASIRKYVDVFHKLMRRYKYLQRGFEDTLTNLLQYINKFSPEDTNKLAMATGLFCASGLASLTVLTVLFKEHLVKEGLSLQFVTTVFKIYLIDQSVDQFGLNLYKVGMSDRLLDFFPPNKRDEDSFARHFEAEDMKQLVVYQNKKQLVLRKESIIENVKTFLEEGKTAECMTFLKAQSKESGLSEPEFIPLIWTGIMASVDWGTRMDQIDGQIVKQVQQYSKLLGAFCTSPKTEIALLQHIQVNFYEDARFIKQFRAVTQRLYNNDVLSESAILYWAEKGVKPQGKTVFMKQMEPFIHWLKNASDEEDSEEEE